MSVRALVLFLFLPTAALAQGFADLGRSADGFTPVTAPATIEFPRDHGAHPGFRIEWWYLTANLRDAAGTDYGAQWTLFRQALSPGPEAAGWASNAAWMGHAAVTSAAHQYSAETFARGGIGQAGVELAPFRAWIDDWTMTGVTAPGDALAELTLKAGGRDFSYDLAARAALPPVLQGDAGFSLKSDAGQASYYYSQPFYRITGSLTLEGKPIAVTGEAWLDREWSSQPLGPDQLGWDWFALHLDDGAKVMLYAMRNRDAPPFLLGTWIDAQGRPTPLRPDQISLTPRSWSQVAGRRIPTGWTIAVPDHGLAVDSVALNAQSWMDTLYPYWEGPIRLSGSHPGRGYLEMTGYR